jgi:putative spermidine/putrescine transport system permease protein
MNLSRRTSWIAATPLLALVALAVVLPFAWRTWGVVADCLRGDDCATRDLVSDSY